MTDKMLAELAELVQLLCEEHDWDEFYNPKDLAIGLSTEVNKLLDIFWFESESDVREIIENPEKREHVTEELADVFFFLLYFAQMNQIDLCNALTDKLGENDRKYPVEKTRGKDLKYTEIQK